MANFQVAKAILLVIFLTGAFQREYTEIYDQYCTADVLSQLTLSNADINDQGGWAKIYVTPAAIISVVNGNGIGDVISQAGVYIILMIILTVICIISFIVFFCFCCCCDRAAGATRGKAKGYTAATILFIVVSIALFIALFVYIGKLNSNINKTSCGISRVPHDLLQGVQNGDINFIGFNNLISLLTNFKSDISNLNTLSGDFDTIINTNLPQTTQSAYDSLTTFYNKYANSTTTDGNGQQTRPITVQSLTTRVNDAVNAEFSIYNEVANKINAAAVIGKNIANSSQTDSIQQSLQTVIDQMNQISTQIQNTFGDVVTGVDYFNRYAPIGYWVTLGIGLLVVILSILAVVILICLIRTSTNRCRFGAKFCLTLNGFLIVLLGIVAIALIVASIGLGSICHALGSLLTTNDVAGEIANYNVTLDPFALKVLNQCLPANATGDITFLLDSGNDVYNQTQNFLDGLTTYDTLKANLTQTTNSSVTIDATVREWQQFRVSIYPDQTNAVSALLKLNNLISCSNFQFQLNAANCTNGVASSSCGGIYNTASYQAPSCSSDTATASSIFTTLKAFTSDEDTLVGNMITDLSGSGSSTPATLFQNSRSGLQSIIGVLDNIEAKLQNTVAVVKTFQSGLGKVTDCRVIRLELTNLQSTFCYGFNKSLYYFTALLAFAVFFLVIYSWTLCCALRYLPDPDVIMGDGKVHNDATLYVNEEDGRPAFV